LLLTIISGERGLLEPQPSLEDSVTLHPVLIYLDLATVIFLFTEQARQFASNPQTEGPSISIYVPQT
jgi:hypothetical protein